MGSTSTQGASGSQTPPLESLKISGSQQNWNYQPTGTHQREEYQQTGYQHHREQYHNTAQSDPRYPRDQSSRDIQGSSHPRDQSSWDIQGNNYPRDQSLRDIQGSNYSHPRDIRYGRPDERPYR